jgi:type II secretory pathway pseudopilin PulG
MKFLNRKKLARGFTLVEILLVVGFIALASIGIYVIYTKVSVTNQANTEGHNLDTLRAGIKNLYGGQSTYTGLTQVVAVNARIVPDSMVTTGATTITNSFGGNVTIAPANLGAGTNNGFTITYPNVPGAVCSKLASTGGTGFDAVSIGGTVVKTFGTNTMNIATVATQCATDTGNGLTMVFSSL